MHVLQRYKREALLQLSSTLGGTPIEAAWYAYEHLLGGSSVGISRAISRVTIVLTYIGELITPLITAHEPPSRVPL